MPMEMLPHTTAPSEAAALTPHRRRFRLPNNLLAAAALVVLPLLYFAPVVRGKLVLLMGDAWSYSALLRIQLGQLLAQGNLPLWNPNIFAGMPLLASLQPGALYPPNWLFAVLAPGVAMNVLLITTYHLALGGSYLYGRSLGMTRAGALVTGLSFTFGGFMVTHLEHTNFVAALAWLPWVLLALERLSQEVTWRWVALGALFSALQLFAGLPQATWLTLLVSGAYVVFTLVARVPRAGRGRFAAASAGVALGGVLLSAIQLLPALELQGQGERAGISYEYFSLYSMPPRRLLTLIFPYFFGGAFPPYYQVPGWDHWWLLKWSYGYIGLAGLLLAGVAVCAAAGGIANTNANANANANAGAGANDEARLVWFWVGVVLVAAVLACGSYLPFELNRWLYRVPVYNLFRGSYRHLFEVSFALAVLAGQGLTCLARLERARARRALRRASLALTILVAATALLYRYFGKALGAEAPPPPQAASLTNAEALVPLLCFALSLGAVWFYAQRRTAPAAALLLAVLLLDLSGFGYSTYWPNTDFNVRERLSDPPAVQFVKQREPDLQAFRVLSYATQPYAQNYEQLSHANLAIARGLQSVSGYDPMRLDRTAALAGQMDIYGALPDARAFSAVDQSFNLLNVKYLFGEQPAVFEETREALVRHAGVPFRYVPLDLKLGPGTHLEFTPADLPTTELALVTTLTDAAHLAEGTPVVRLRLHTREGRVVERELQAGRDTAEWAYGRADVARAARHQRAAVSERWDAGGFEGFRYLTRLPFERATLDYVEVDYLLAEANCVFVRASLYDAVTGQAAALDVLRLPPERWRQLARFGAVAVYENLQARPRAWFVSRLAVVPRAEVLRTIRTGLGNDGAAFDPAQTALLESEDFAGGPPSLPPMADATDAQAQVTRYEPQRIVLATRQPRAGFLVLSEIYYRGWEARIDGQPTPVRRVNYALRGIAVPPGAHQIEFVFRAPTFWQGAACSALGLALLLLPGLRAWRRRRTCQ